MKETNRLRMQNQNVNVLLTRVMFPYGQHHFIDIHVIVQFRNLNRHYHLHPQDTLGQKSSTSWTDLKFASYVSFVFLESDLLTKTLNKQDVNVRHCRAP